MCGNNWGNTLKVKRKAPCFVSLKKSGVLVSLKDSAVLVSLGDYR
jgi:hypothetical protein